MNGLPWLSEEVPGFPLWLQRLLNFTLFLKGQISQRGPRLVKQSDTGNLVKEVLWASVFPPVI